MLKDLLLEIGCKIVEAAKASPNSIRQAIRKDRLDLLAWAEAAAQRQNFFFIQRSLNYP